LSGHLPVLQIVDVSKDYHALRPLRIERLALAARDRVALVGFDQPMAEIFVNLVTGAALPDRGEVTVLGRRTASIRDTGDWLTVVDRIGIVSERAVLIDQLTVIQTLSMPFTLDIDPPSDVVRGRAEHLAREAGLPEPTWARPVGELDPGDRLRARLARALALDPALLLLEHPTVAVPARVQPEIAAQIGRIAARRGFALVALTADEPFARAAASRILKLDAASGRLVHPRGIVGFLRH
jgi:ABC-type lipoprotein export system ATPase subunit